MADLTDVEAAIVNIVGGTIYPNGFSQASVLPGGASAKIARGWPLPASLDADLAAGNCQITVYPLSGSYHNTYQILDQTYLISPPVINLAFTITGSPVTVQGGGTTISVTGQPAVGEYITIIADNAHIYSATGATTTALLAALASQAQVDYPAASSTATTVTVPVNAYMAVQQGGQAIQGKVIRRQCHSIMVSVWAPSDTIRTAAAIAADVAIKENIKITMPDTSQCILRYQRTMSSDQQEKAVIYRRDLIFEAEYATVQEFPAYVITSVTTTLANPSGTAQDIIVSPRDSS